MITVDLPYPVFVSSVAVDFVPSAASTSKVFTVHGYEDKLGSGSPRCWEDSRSKSTAASATVSERVEGR